MVKKGIESGICNAIHKYTKTNIKYMKDYDLSADLSYRIYWDASNFYGWAISQTLPVDGLKWKKNKSKFTQNFIQYYNDDSNKGYVSEIDVSYPKRLQKSDSDLSFTPERMKIDKCQKLVCNVCNKKDYMSYTCIFYVVHKKAYHGLCELMLEKVHMVIKFNQKVWLKPYIDMNKELRKKAKDN